MADVAVGLHFAGETDPDPAAEHALACEIHKVLDKLSVRLTPLATATQAAAAGFTDEGDLPLPRSDGRAARAWATTDGAKCGCTPMVRWN